ncbi:DUF4136 domain-containing protein [Inhella gelatinilytica]|uniref:DUF4136 domain-containing protein n=1 Tax=Inhella gelatinilytica TaxID=2795030 RepID=A0A931NBS8_9BURK|nr:DUF4136 domain-containing protein [Inhella gelatinilytica]MBH9551252.1 DUF4136 domain-containing protein [Inhella gelatinilytica]
MSPHRRTLLSLSALALLGGCAALKTLAVDVRSFGAWPADKKAGTYAFERLPSQQDPLSRAAEWETLAAPALEKAGFKPAPAGTPPDVIVALGVRISAVALSPWDDPLWYRWNAPLYHWRFGMPPRAHPLFVDRRYEREVGVLLRDRVSGQPLYEARASSDGSTQGGDALMAALFQAALADFPKAQPQPHVVRIQLP